MQDAAAGTEPFLCAEVEDEKAPGTFSTFAWFYPKLDTKAKTKLLKPVRAVASRVVAVRAARPLPPP
jgi:hypothetical protein